MNRFNRYQIIATLCIAVFIISFSICILSIDRHGYRISVDRYYHTLSDSDYVSGELTKGQMKLCYDILADEVTSFSKTEYELPGYNISSANADRLSAISGWCRAARIFAVLSFIGFVYSFMILSRRRFYMPLAYGSAFAALFTSLGALMILLSRNELLCGIKNMILYRDYSYFVDGDIVRSLLPGNLARIIAAEFLVIELVVIGVFVLLNYVIKRSGRPHEF